MHLESTGSEHAIAVPDASQEAKGLMGHGGDVIVAIDNQPVQEMDDLIAYLVEEARPGDEVNLDVIRSNGERESIILTLGKRPQSDTVNQTNS